MINYIQEILLSIEIDLQTITNNEKIITKLISKKQLTLKDTLQIQRLTYKNTELVNIINRKLTGNNLH